MVKRMQSGARKAVKTVARKARVRHSAYVIKAEYLAELERMRLMDDTFMSKCLENAPECIELILRVILGKKDLKVVKSQTEYPIKSLQGRGVRFDVFARDSRDREYDIEIQRAKDGAEPRRARYNSALMDANALKSGEDFGKLRDTYVIFITETDVMKRGQGMYVFDRMDRTSGLDFGDGAHVVYANGTWRGNDDLGRLMHDFNCSDPSDMNFDVLSKQVYKFKNSEEGRREMCEAMERIEARGKRETMLATAKRMLKDGVLALKDIARYSGLTLAQVKKLQAEMA